MPKITHHIPTEQFGYTEVEMAETEFVPYNEAKSLYGACGASEGLSTKEFNSAVCEYLETGELKEGTELYQRMSPEQKEWFQITKKAVKRINYKD